MLKPYKDGKGDTDPDIMSRRIKYYEEYRKCGCVSETLALKRDLPGYCPKHGTDRAKVHNTALEPLAKFIKKK